MLKKQIIIIKGDQKSGKTTLAKSLIAKYDKKDIYISTGINHYVWKISGDPKAILIDECIGLNHVDQLIKKIDHVIGAGFLNPELIVFVTC